MKCRECNMDLDESMVYKEESLNKIGVKMIKVMCLACDSYIKFEKYSFVPDPMEIIPFGKHKGKSCMDIALHDKDYAVWFISNNKGRYKDALEMALDLNNRDDDFKF